MHSPFRLFLRMNGWMALLAVVSGLVIVAIGGYEIRSGMALSAQETSTIATLTGKRETQGSRMGGKLRTNYSITLGYDTAKGHIKTRANATSAFYFSHEIGDQIEIFFLPGSPETFEFTPGSTSKTGWQTALFGGFVSAGGLWMLLIFTKRAKRAAGLTQRIEAQITEVVKMRGGAYLAFVFRPAGGAAVMGKSLSHATKRLAGWEKGQSITVLYDPSDPAFAFWQRDLEPL